MRAKKDERRKARELRAAGLSLRAISRELGVALSSVSVWTRDVPPPDARTRPEAGDPPQVDEPGVRRCSRCARELPLSNFNRCRGGRQWWCRECFGSYYRDKKKHHRARNDSLLARRVEDARKHVYAVLASAVCCDCGLADPLVLEFDHLREKRLEISTMVARGAKPSALDAEMTKCDVVCVNCHRRRTAHRSGWRRLDLGVASPFRSRAQERNVLHCYCVLLASGCVDCRCLDLCALDFDHQGDKSMSVTRLAHREVGLARLCDEMRKCVVRCGNCHRRRTARAAGHARTWMLAEPEYPQRGSNP